MLRDNDSDHRRVSERQTSAVKIICIRKAIASSYDAGDTVKGNCESQLAREAH